MTGEASPASVDPAALGLDAAEVAALLGAGSGATVPPLATAPPAGLRRTAAMAARRLGAALGRCLGEPADVGVAWVAVADPYDLAAAIPDPMCAFWWRPRAAGRGARGPIDPAQGRDGVSAVLELAPPLARQVVHRMLGAPPAPLAPDRVWTPSPSGWDVLAAAVDGIGADLADLLGHRPTVLGYETDPRLLAGLGAPLAACAFEILTSGGAALAHLLLPGLA